VKRNAYRSGSGIPSNATPPKHVAVIEQNIQTSVALNENPEPDLVQATRCKQPTLKRVNVVGGKTREKEATKKIKT
jgi:hypothetical protein